VDHEYVVKSTYISYMFYTTPRIVTLWTEQKTAGNPE
jgi:hypothetical protein